MQSSVTLDVGAFYKTNDGRVVQYLGNYEGLVGKPADPEGRRKIKVPRKSLSIKMLDPRFAAGAASVMECTVEHMPNNALYITGSRESLEKMAMFIFKQCGFTPGVCLSRSSNGVAQPGYPRIEVHPSNVVEIP